MSAQIAINGVLYAPDHTRFKIPYGSLDGLRFGEIPDHHFLIVTKAPQVDGVKITLRAENNSYSGGTYMHCFVRVSCGDDEENRVMSRAYTEFPEFSIHYDTERSDDSTSSFDIFRRVGKEDLVKYAIDEVIDACAGLKDVKQRIFICHASEDKPIAREVSKNLRRTGAHVWLDEWEISVGDSIVSRIDEGLTRATHVVLLLSRHSCAKAWVEKEWMSALMRHLSDKSISLLPVRLDDQPVPALLADLRYADCRTNLASGLGELRASLSARTRPR